jgi:hypothetical protein
MERHVRAGGRQARAICESVTPRPAIDESSAGAACCAERIFRHNSAKADDPMTPDDRDTDANAPTEPGATSAAGRPAPARGDENGGESAAGPVRDDGVLGNLPEGVRQRVESWVPELVKKAVAAGMGAVFTTEESIRKLTKEMPMPKEVAGYLVNTASSTKDELFRIVAREVREFLSSVNISEEIAKMLTTLSFEIKTEIRFIPNAEKYTGVEPDVKASVRLKRNEAGPRRRMFRRKGGEHAPGTGAPPVEGEGDE